MRSLVWSVLALAFLVTGPAPAASGAAGLTSEQALLGSGVIDLQPQPQDFAKGRATPADLKRHLRDLCSNKETVKGVGAYINKRRYFDRGSLLNPWTVYQPGGQPVLSPANQLAGSALAPESLAGNQKAAYLVANGVEELPAGYKKNGVTFRFVDVKLTYALQKVPNCKTKPGEKPHRAAFDLKSDDFKEKYYILTDGTDHSGREFRFGDRISANPARKAFHPADVAFDPGVPDGTAPVTAGKGDPAVPTSDVLMEVFVKLDGRAESFDGTQWTTAMDFTQMNLVASREFYVEDVVPPLPSDVDINQSPVELELPPAAAGAEVPPKHDFILSAYTGDFEAQPGAPGGWPSTTANEDANGDGKNDAAFEPVHVIDRNSNTNAQDIKVSFNYETGLSLGNRVKVRDGDGYRYMYLVLPERLEGTMVGPYGGRVGQAPAPNETAEDDPYEPRDELLQIEGEAQPVPLRTVLDPFYKEVAFDSDAELKQAVDFLYSRNPVEVQQGLRPKTDGTRDYTSATYPRVAGIAMAEEREVVQGISCEVFDNKSTCDAHMSCVVDFKFKVNPASLLPPVGFASFEGGSFHASLDAKTMNHQGPASLNGGPLNPLDAADNFYQINAGDGCGNTTIFRAGTFGVRDNLRPNPKVVLEEMYTRPGQEQRIVDVVTVPNDIGGAGDPVGGYDVSRPHSRLPKMSEVSPWDRLYGNFRNNSETWDAAAKPGTLQNPTDAKAASFLTIRSAADAPIVNEDSRFRITVSAEDNVAPRLDRASGTPRFLYPMSHLSARIYRRDNPADEVYKATIVDVPKAQLADTSQFTKAPFLTFEHVFRAEGVYEMEVVAVDRSENRRVLKFPIPVGKVGMDFRRIEGEQQRGGGD
ncbi:MAG: hypothetical protein HY816_16395 [Candidatus Wallbacteria bacterium]|nr:hypothetical protein [Candidatus Wallbacteria bacterium]